MTHIHQQKMPPGSQTARTNNSTATYTIAPNKKFAGQHSSLKHLPVRSPGHSPLSVRAKLKNGPFRLLKGGSFDLHQQGKPNGERKNLADNFNASRSNGTVGVPTGQTTTLKPKEPQKDPPQHRSPVKETPKPPENRKFDDKRPAKVAPQPSKPDEKRLKEPSRPAPVVTGKSVAEPKGKFIAPGASKPPNNSNRADYLNVPSPLIGQLDLATPTIRPGTTILRHRSLENLPDSDPDWLQQCRGKIHRRIHHKADDPVKISGGFGSKIPSPGRQKPTETAADVSVRSGTATVRNSQVKPEFLPCISPRDFLPTDPPAQTSTTADVPGATKISSRSYYSQAERRWKNDSKLRSLQRANQMMQNHSNTQANLKVVSSDYSSSDSITSNHSGPNRSPTHQKHSDVPYKCRCTCECCIKGCWPSSSPNMVVVGRKAPDFSGFALVKGLFDQISLTSYRGKYLVVIFCPFNLSSERPVEVMTFNNRLEEFRKISTELIFCSTDKQFGPKLWTTSPGPSTLSGIKFPLLADESHDIARSYGVCSRDGQILRGTFIIDEKGVVRHTVLSDGRTKLSPDDLVRLVQQTKSSAL